jgi:hypothetical protein
LWLETEGDLLPLFDDFLDEAGEEGLEGGGLAAIGACAVTRGVWSMTVALAYV